MELSVISRVDTHAGDLSKAADKRYEHQRDKNWYKSLFQCLSRNFGKGFLIGGTGWAIVSTSRAVMGSFRGRPIRLSDIFNQYTMDWGTLLGAMLALFNGTMYLTARERIGYRTFEELESVGKQPTTLDKCRRWLHHYRGAFAGAACGLGMIMGPQDRETKKTLALFMAIRALEVQAKIFAHKGYLPTLSESTAGVLLMSLSSAQILWAWIFEPTANDPFYQAFLDRHGQKPRLRRGF